MNYISSDLKNTSSKSEEHFCGEEQQHEEQSTTNTENSIKSAQKKFSTPWLVAALDNRKISERDTIHLIIAFIEAVALNPVLIVINQTSIKNQRNYFQEIYSKKIKVLYRSNNYPLGHKIIA